MKHCEVLSACLLVRRGEETIHGRSANILIETFRSPSKLHLALANDLTCSLRMCSSSSTSSEVVRRLRIHLSHFIGYFGRTFNILHLRHELVYPGSPIVTGTGCHQLLGLVTVLVVAPWLIFIPASLTEHSGVA